MLSAGNPTDTKHLLRPLRNLRKHSAKHYCKGEVCALVETDGRNGEVLMSAVDENNGAGWNKCKQTWREGWMAESSNFLPHYIFSCTISIFLVDWDLTTLEQCRRAFRLALNPQKEHGSLWIWLWKFSYCRLCVGDGFASRLFRSKIRVLISECDPFGYVVVNYGLIYDTK